MEKHQNVNLKYKIHFSLLNIAPWETLVLTLLKKLASLAEKCYKVIPANGDLWSKSVKVVSIFYQDR